MFRCFTAYEATFFLQHDSTRQCLYQERRRLAGVGSLKFVVRSYGNCDGASSNFRWLWTKYGQLLHWETLECMSDDYPTRYYNYIVLVLKECGRNNKEQRWKCGEQNKKYIQLLINPYEDTVYLDDGHDDYVTIRYERRGLTAQWTHYGTQENVCSQGNCKNQRNNDESETTELNIILTIIVSSLVYSLSQNKTCPM